MTPEPQQPDEICQTCGCPIEAHSDSPPHCPREMAQQPAREDLRTEKTDWHRVQGMYEVEAAKLRAELAKANDEVKRLREELDRIKNPHRNWLDAGL